MAKIPVGEVTQESQIERPLKRPREKSPKTPEVAVEVPLTVGTTIEHLRNDGDTIVDTYIGSFEMDGQNHVDILAHTNGKETRVRVVKPGEMNARATGSKRVQLLEGAYESAVESAIKASGAKGAEAKRMRAGLEGRGSSIVAEAASGADPEQTIIEAIQTETKPHTLAELLNMRVEANKRFNNAKTEKAANQLYPAIMAIENAMRVERLRLNPKATKSEKGLIADESEGAVSIMPDALYEKGIEAVKERVRILREFIEKEEEKRIPNGPAWLAAYDEMNRHIAMMPRLKQAEQMTELEQTVVSLLASEFMDVQEAEGYIKTRKQNSITKHEQNMAEQGAVVRGEQNTLREKMYLLDSLLKEKKMPAEKKAEVKRKIEVIQDKLKELDLINQVLNEAKVAFDFAPQQEDRITEASRSSLFRTLRDLYKSGQETAVMKYVDKVLKSRSISESTRLILNAFKKDVSQKPEAVETTVPDAQIPAIDVSEPTIPDAKTPEVVSVAEEPNQFDKIYESNFLSSPEVTLQLLERMEKDKKRSLAIGGDPATFAAARRVLARIRSGKLVAPVTPEAVVEAPTEPEIAVQATTEPTVETRIRPKAEKEKQPEFKWGDRVRVKRRDGTIDDDWSFRKMDDTHAYLFRVNKDDKNKMDVFKMRLKEFIKLNPDGGVPFEDKIATDEAVAVPVEERADTLDDVLSAEIISDEPNIRDVDTQDSLAGKNLFANKSPQGQETGPLQLDEAKTPTEEQIMKQNEPKPFSEEETKMKDLIQSGFLSEGGDLADWKEKFEELKKAMGISNMERRGLPEHFWEITDAKDTRRWWQKAFGSSETQRVQLMRQLAKIYNGYKAETKTVVS